MSKAEVNRYNSLDGLRAYSAIAIVCMHIYVNANYNIAFIEDIRLLMFSNNLTFLFMMISAFSMCCGYYERIITAQIAIEDFYNKRYKRILPFFTCLVILALVLEHNINALIEGFADITLVFGLLPNANISVIGVGWFLGVIFVFYMIFPWFCYLLKNKRRAYIALAVSVIFNLLCTFYFFDENHLLSGFNARTNFIYCSMFFMAGGLIYIERLRLINICRRFRYVFIIIAFLMTAAILLFDKLSNSYIMPVYLTILFSIYLIYAISTNGKFLNNRIASYISDISMEIYLSHMMIYRIVEKTGLTICFDDIVSYALTTAAVLIGSVVFSKMFKLLYNKAGLKLNPSVDK